MKSNHPYHRYGVPLPLIVTYLRSLPAPDLILSGTTMTYWYPGLWEIVRILRDLFPLSTIALGGIYATLCPDHARNAGAHFIFSGPGEAHIPVIVKDLLGLTLDYNPDLQSLDTLPYPAYDLIPNPDALPLLTSRGCPLNCPYCASRILFPHVRRRDPLQVVAEIDYWRTSLGVRDFALYDDAFLMEGTNFAHPFLEALVHNQWGVRLHCPNGLHIRAIDAHTATLMFRAGVTNLRLGLETADEKLQVESGRKVSNDEFTAAIRYLTEAGYDSHEIGVYLLCGLPHQEPQEVLNSIHFVRAHGARPILAEYSPIPGTSWWEEAVAASPYPLAQEPLYHNNSLLPCWAGRPELKQAYRQLKSLIREKNVENVR